MPEGQKRNDKVRLESNFPSFNFVIFSFYLSVVPGHFSLNLTRSIKSEE